MANIGTVYLELSQLYKLAEQVNDANYTSDADLGELAVKLEEIEDIAGRNRVILDNLDTALLKG